MALREMPWEQAIEFALDELNVDAVGNEIVTRESVPFFAVAYPEPKLLDGADIDPLFVLVGRIVSSIVGPRRGQKSGDIQEAGNFDVLQVIHHVERRVIIVESGEDA